MGEEGRAANAPTVEGFAKEGDGIEHGMDGGNAAWGRAAGRGKGFLLMGSGVRVRKRVNGEGWNRRGRSRRHEIWKAGIGREWRAGVVG
jgi:hypothetical protein